MILSRTINLKWDFVVNLYALQETEIMTRFEAQFIKVLSTQLLNKLFNIEVMFIVTLVGKIIKKSLEINW
jgi:hypothetical protein